MDDIVLLTFFHNGIRGTCVYSVEDKVYYDKLLNINNGLVTYEGNSVDE